MDIPCSILDIQKHLEFIIKSLLIYAIKLLTVFSISLEIQQKVFFRLLNLFKNEITFKCNCPAGMTKEATDILYRLRDTANIKNQYQNRINKGI